MRCAIYTRKSTEEGLEQEFNSLDAQRDAGEKYIESQRGEGWECLHDRYDDGGYTGGNMDRPALKRLLNDIEAGRVDCVVVYKVDRLSRSLVDFSKIVEHFDRHQVSFVSVTQQFNTASSMGRLMLNVLLSFAQFEREIISERTRDKIAAARRKGKWAGGMPLLGYDIIRPVGGSKLVVNEDEAARVRQIFQLYLDENSLTRVGQILNDRGWTTKAWTTKKGQARGGKPFDRGRLFHMLTNPVYIGKIKYKDDVHDGEHEAIVPIDLWKQVQTRLRYNAHSGGAIARNKYNALLRGLIYCSHCGAPMTHTYTTKRSVRYRYYVCQHAQKEGWHTCPSKSIPAPAAEQFVVDQIRSIGNDPSLVAQTIAVAHRQAADQIAALREEQGILTRELKSHHAQVRAITDNAAQGIDGNRLAELQERVTTAERRNTAIAEEITALQKNLISEDEIIAAMADFDPVWDALSPRQQHDLIHLLIERIEYDGQAGEISITFHPTGIRSLAERKHQHDEVAA
jgi:site-specific DNA recombinase